MVRRSLDEWRGLFEEHARSGMTERTFCELRGVAPKYFNLRKKQLGWKAEAPCPSPFVLVQKAPPLEVSHVPSAVLRLGRCEWELRDVSADWLVSVIAALA